MSLVHHRECQCCEVARKRISEVAHRVDLEIASYVSFKAKVTADYTEARERTKHLVADWAAEPWRSRAGTFFNMTSINTQNALAQLCSDLRQSQDENCILRAALQMFVDMPEKIPEDKFLDGWARMRAAFANAKAVLQTP